MATYQLKKDVAGYYFWILKSDNNGKIVAKSSEAYNSKQGAKECNIGIDNRFGIDGNIGRNNIPVVHSQAADEQPADPAKTDYRRPEY